MKYKVGDRVKVKSLQWFNENSGDNHNVVFADGWHFSEPMSIFCGKELIIENLSYSTNPPYYIMKDNIFAWTDEMIEGLVEEESEKKLSDESWRYKNVFDYSQYPQSFELPKGYQFVDENGNVINATKIVLEKKKKEYPKTYEECAKIMNCPIAGPSGWLFNFDANIKDPYYRKIDILMGKFTRLLICRDAYWKLYGEEMGLGKPWEPSGNEDCFVISRSCGEVYLYSSGGDCELFEFPTKEMRDAFKENFKELIESVKELL